MTHSNRITNIVDPFFENELNNPDVSDTRKLLSLSKSMPPTELGKCFTQKVSELLGTIQVEEAVVGPKPPTDEEYDKFFKGS